MIRESIIHFLENGQFDQLKNGMTLDEIVALIGQTKWIIPISSTDMRPAMMKYGKTEFYFNEETPQCLKGIQISYSMAAKDYDFELDLENFQQAEDVRVSQTLLEEKNVPYTLHDDYLETESGITVKLKYDIIQKINNFE